MTAYITHTREGSPSRVLDTVLVPSPRGISHEPMLCAIAYHLEDGIAAIDSAQDYRPHAVRAHALAWQACGRMWASVADGMGISSDDGIALHIAHPVADALETYNVRLARARLAYALKTTMLFLAPAPEPEPIDLDWILRLDPPDKER